LPSGDSCYLGVQLDRQKVERKRNLGNETHVIVTVNDNMYSIQFSGSIVNRLNIRIFCSWPDEWGEFQIPLLIHEEKTC
jgi:hypothetical protein